MDISLAMEISGWMQVECLEWLALQASIHQSICEVGSWLGRSTRALADNTSGQVYAVDTWRGGSDTPYYYEGKSFLDDFLCNMEGTSVKVIMNTSLAAAAGMSETFDMIFIDASHDYDNVKADILAWSPHLREGGLLCGHDYHTGGGEGVIRAVDELIPSARVVPGTNIWYKP